jgi:hypothetical protein
MTEIVNISYVGSGIETQTYTEKDNSLITNSFIYTQFGDPKDSIEYFIYDGTGNLIDKVYNSTSYKPNSSVNSSTDLYGSIILDPKSDLLSRGFNRGTLDIQYNFLRNLFNSSYGKFYWIKEISPSRTEIRLASQNISNIDILSGFNQYQSYIASLNYYNDFYLNFGDNKHIIAVNVAYTEDESGAYLLIKLYEPLPSDFDVKDQLWISEKIAESSRYTVDIQIEASNIVEQNVLRGPNYNINLNQQISQTTPYYSYSGLTSTSVSSSFQKMMSYYQDRAMEINVDYSDFSNFIHFSSVNSRIQNFYSKVSNIENYNNIIISQSSILDTSGVVSSSIVGLRNDINSIITNFDPYEYYLYFGSGSYTWPKSNAVQPYSLYSVTSSVAINWMNSSLQSASLFDNTNKDLLTNIIPQYILDDESNAPYVSFVNMIGQHFDNIWIYYKDVTNRFQATNNPSTGISLDLVADALIGLGSTLYTNSNLSDNLYYSLFGINEDGSLLPPTGSEKNITYITSSLETLSPKTIQSEIYKRIYHNIPYLYKTKGTRNCIDAIVNIFGIPKSILTIDEFGGYERDLYTGLDSAYNTKITGSTAVDEVSGSTLNPNVTIQYYNNTDRINSNNLEFGFSPANSINNFISSSRGFINIDQLIGDPSYQYSSSYLGLQEYQNSFFTGSQVHDIYEYIRLLKYFDNSLFKMIKDYVPARSNLSNGLIVKSHVLERNRYERHEPIVENDFNYSQSLETSVISATDAPVLLFPTSYTTETQYTVVSPYIATGSNNTYGPVRINNNYSWEKYTGEFGGSKIDAAYGEFSQLERSSITSPWTSSVASTQSIFTFYNNGAFINNVINSQESSKFINAEYSYGIDSPINFASIVSQSSCENCHRIDCLTYQLYNGDTSPSLYSYIDCNNLYYDSSSINPTSSVYICVKPGTLLTSSFITSSILGNCGALRVDTPYGSCYKTTITNFNTSDSLDINWTNCNGSTGSATIPAGAGVESAQQCVRRGSMQISRLAISPTYSVSEYNECGVFSNSPSCYSFTGSWSATGGGETGSYKDCYTGETIFQIFPDGGPTTVRVSCAQTGSFRVFTNNGSTIVSSLSNVILCANPGEIIPDPENSRCIKLDAVSVGVGYYTLGYDKCNGESVLLSGSSIGESLVLNDCVRLNSIVSSNVVAIITGSYCGYYSKEKEYTGSLDYAEIQDYNYNRTSAVHSKYAGAKYSNQDTSQDWKFGASYNPRDYYVDYTGLFTEIQSSSYDPSQMIVKLPYLANISGGIQELNLQNENLVYFQSIYKPGTNVTLKQFNSTQYSNQKYLDKSFKIVESGFSYRPYFYRKMGQQYECYDLSIGGDSFLSGSKALRETSIKSGVENDIVNSIFYPDPFGLARSFSTIPSGSSLSGSWNWYNTSLDIGASTSSSLATNIISDPNNLLTAYSSGSGDLSGSFYTVPFDGVYSITAGFPWNMRIVEVPTLTANFRVKVEILRNATTSSGFLEGEILATKTDTVSSGDAGVVYGGFTTAQILNTPLQFGQTIWTKVSIQAGFNDVQVFGMGAYFEAESSKFNGSYCINPSSAINKLFDTSSFLPGNNVLTISENMNPFFLENVTFIPSYTSGSITESPLYETFGEVDYGTKIEEGDYLYLYYSGISVGYSVGGMSTPILSRITSITTGSVTSSFTVYPNLPSYITNGNLNSYDKLVFTKRIPDETTITLRGKKNAGKTSYGFAIPQDINPEILKNANTLQSTIQSQILNY